MIALLNAVKFENHLLFFPNYLPNDLNHKFFEQLFGLVLMLSVD